VPIDTWKGGYGVFMTSLYGSFVVSGKATSKIHRNYNFNWKIIIPHGFDP